MNNKNNNKANNRCKITDIYTNITTDMYSKLCDIIERALINQVGDVLDYRGLPREGFVEPPESIRCSSSAARACASSVLDLFNMPIDCNPLD